VTFGFPARLTFRGRPCVPEAAMNDKHLKEKPAPSCYIPPKSKSGTQELSSCSFSNLSRQRFRSARTRPSNSFLLGSGRRFAILGSIRILEIGIRPIPYLLRPQPTHKQRFGCL